MGFLQWWWSRAELYVKVIFIYVVLIMVTATLAITYESRTLYTVSQMIALSYFVWLIGYEMLYKAVKEKYNAYCKERDSLFDEIKNPK